MLYLRYRYGYGRSLLSILGFHFDHIFVRLLEAYRSGQNVAVLPEILGAVSGCVAYCSRKTSKTQWRRIFWKNGRTFWGKTVQVGTDLQTRLWCYLARHRDRQLQQNSWDGGDRTGNECQLDGSKGEVEVCATPVCLLRGVLYWMYCMTSISMSGTHWSIRAVTDISLTTLR